MLKICRSALGYACLALAAALSLVGYASAAESLTSYHLRALALDTGRFGAETAKLKAELAYAHGDEYDDLCTSGSLTRESNGFRLTSMIADLASTISGVAKGKIGVGAGATA